MKKHTDKNNGHTFIADLEKIKENLSDKTREFTKKASETLIDSVEGIKHTTHIVQKNLKQLIKEQPYKSVGIAFLSGIIIGYLTKKTK